MTIVAELHDFRRFVTPRALMAYLALVPSEQLGFSNRSLNQETSTNGSSAASQG
jgi:hypothetical protein